VTKSSNHTYVFTCRLLILLQLLTSCGYLLPKTLILVLSLYRLGSHLTENMCNISECMFIGPLPSTGRGVDHIEKLLPMLFYCCVRVFWALPRNESTCHNIFVDFIIILSLHRRICRFIQEERLHSAFLLAHKINLSQAKLRTICFGSWPHKSVT
jgi:hypothetical protein